MKTKTILLVEDDEELKNQFKEQLTNIGYNVIDCSKVSEAIWRLRQGELALILTDIKLKDGSGDQLIDMVRKDKKGLNYKTPIIVISAHLDQETIQGIGNKISAALVKPFKPAQLIERVNAVCGA